jgi:hypothetical protein
LQSFIVLTLPFLMLESPTWLIQNKNYREARQVLNQIASMNGSQYRVPKHSILVLKPISEGGNASEDEVMDMKNILKDIWQNNKLNEYYTLSLFISNCVFWYLGYFLVAKIPGNIFVNGMVYSMVDSFCQLIGARIGMYLGPFRAHKTIMTIALTAIAVKMSTYDSNTI